MREACYRVMGEGYSNISSFVDFGDWYSNELGPLLQHWIQEFRTGSPDMITRVLQSRALWLVGVCGGALPPQQWGNSFHLLVEYMASQVGDVADIVLRACLNAVMCHAQWQNFPICRPACSQEVPSQNYKAGCTTAELFVYNNI